MKMKLRLLHVAFAAFVVCAVSFADVYVPPPIVHLSFDVNDGVNEPLQNKGTAAPDAGRIEIRDNRVVTYSTGLKGEALDTTANTMGSPGSYLEMGIDGSVDTPIEQALNAGLTSFTICGWMYPTAAFTTSVSPFDRELSGTSYHYQIRLWCNDIYGRFRLFVNDQLTTGNPASEMAYWNYQNEWFFFAVTYDSTAGSNQVKFYTGDNDYEGHVWMTADADLNAGVLQSSDAAMWLASTNTSGSASYQGLRDEFRIFGSTEGSQGALTLEQLQEVQARDLGKPFCGDTNNPYPEGDLNYDCIVNFEDFAKLADVWLSEVY